RRVAVVVAVEPRVAFGLLAQPDVVVASVEARVDVRRGARLHERKARPVHEDERGVVRVEERERVLRADPRGVAELDRDGQPVERAQGGVEAPARRVVVAHLRRELEQNRAQAPRVAEPIRHEETPRRRGPRDLLHGAFREKVLRQRLGRLHAELEAGHVARLLDPARDDAARRRAVERAVDLDGGEGARVEREPVARLQRTRIDAAHPVVVRPTRAPDARGQGKPLTGSLDLEQDVLAFDVLPGLDVDLLDDAARGRRDLVLHLHRFEDEEHLARLHFLAFRDRDADDLARHGGTHTRAARAALLARAGARAKLRDAEAHGRAVDRGFVVAQLDINRLAVEDDLAAFGELRFEREAADVYLHDLAFAREEHVELLAVDLEKDAHLTPSCCAWPRQAWRPRGPRGAWARSGGGARRGCRHRARA